MDVVSSDNVHDLMHINNATIDSHHMSRMTWIWAVLVCIIIIQTHQMSRLVSEPPVRTRSVISTPNAAIHVDNVTTMVRVGRYCDEIVIVQSASVNLAMC